MKIGKDKLSLIHPRKTTSSFHTKTALRAEFKVFNRNWAKRFRMRIVRVEGDDGYAGVLRVRS